MKKIIISMVFLIASVLEIKAQENVVKVNILSPFVYTGSVSFEHAFNWSTSYEFGFSFTPVTEVSGGYFGTKQELSGFSATLGLRKYFAKDALHGLYYGPYLRHQSITLKADDISATISVSSAGLKLGYQFIIGEVFSIDLFSGTGIGMYDIGDSDGFAEATSILGSGKMVTSTITFGFNLGYAF